MDDRESQIRQRAYDLWIEAGRPEGDPEQFWLQAERDLSEDDPAASNKGAAMTSDEELDKQLEDTTPASDPPSATQP